MSDIKFPSNKPIFAAIVITELDFCRAWIEVCETFGIEHEDSPMEDDLIQVRKILAQYAGQDLKHISLHWIRNVFVKLRKAQKIKGYRDSR